MERSGTRDERGMAGLDICLTLTRVPRIFHAKNVIVEPDVALDEDAPSSHDPRLSRTQSVPPLSVKDDIGKPHLCQFVLGSRFRRWLTGSVGLRRSDYATR